MYQRSDLPTVTQQCPQNADAKDGQVGLSPCDGLVIYTDGSSRAQICCKPILWVQDEDVPDAWSSLFLGGKYAGD